VGFHQGNLFSIRIRKRVAYHTKEIFMLQNPATPRFQIVTTLSSIRQEWQEAAEGKSLIEVEGNIGMLLADLINGIGLGTSEQVQVLGKDLFREMQDFLRSPIRN
jgi:hypothetical protein